MEYKIEKDKYGNFSIYKKMVKPSGLVWWAICGSRESEEDAELFITEHRSRS